MTVPVNISARITHSDHGYGYPWLNVARTSPVSPAIAAPILAGHRLSVTASAIPAMISASAVTLRASVPWP